MPAMPAANDDVFDLTSFETGSGNVLINDETLGGVISIRLDGVAVDGEGPTQVAGTFGIYQIDQNGNFTFEPYDWVAYHRFFNSDLTVTASIEYSFEVAGEIYSANLEHEISGPNRIAVDSFAPSGENPNTVEYFNEFNEFLYSVTTENGVITYFEFANDTDFALGLASQTFIYSADGEARERTILYQDGSTTQINYDFAEEEEYISETINFNAAGNRTSLIRELDNGGTVGVSFTQNGGNVAARAQETDADGNVVANLILFANEQIVRTQFDTNGVVELVSYFDEAEGAGAPAWDEINNFYEGGVLTRRSILYDNLDIKATTYDIESDTRTVSLTDGSNTRSWALREKTFDANGDFTGDHFVFDNGFDRTREYFDDGSLQRLFVIDGANEKSWAQLERVYDAAGDLVSVNQFKDNNDQIESTYATGGILQTRTFTDFSETKDYYSRTYTYDASGTIIDTVTVEDGIFGG